MMAWSLKTKVTVAATLSMVVVLGCVCASLLYSVKRDMQ